MLIICNGAYKSGSTWLFRILLTMTQYDLIPPAYHAPGWNGLGIKPSLLAKFLKRENYRDHNYILKGHFFLQYHIIVGKPNVTVMNIRRDTRDVVVSAFHYERMKGKCQSDSFEGYYWTRGWRIAQQVIRYNRLWENKPNTYMSSYETLHTDFPGEVHRLASFLGFSLSQADVQRLHDENTLESLREKYDEKSSDGKMSFYRKGVIGDWQEHMSEEIVQDIARIDREEAGYPTRMDLLNLRGRYAVSKWRDK
ncbi:MAG TPA: sulfotransferase domain-containing protein [Tepidisphaeraceae bacterium]|nr:sulfotransferase domain-containing protein [Tepidisphaeraceae bacterium]